MSITKKSIITLAVGLVTTVVSAGSFAQSVAQEPQVAPRPDLGIIVPVPCVPWTFCLPVPPPPDRY